MKAKLHCTSGKYEGKTYHIKSEATIGRSGENDIVLDEMVVSNSHARIYFDTEDQQFYIDDLNSRTGVMIGDEFVEVRHPLNEGDVLTIGNAFEFGFSIAKRETDTAEPTSVPAQSKDKAPEPETDIVPDTKSDSRPQAGETQPSEKRPEEQPSAEVGASSETVDPDEQTDEPDDEEKRVSAFYFESKSLDGTDEHHSLIAGVNLVGREASNRLILKDGSVSRHHAVVIAKKDEVIVRDLDSKNGTYVDGDKVTEDSVAKEGARIMFGLVGFTLRRNA